MTMRTKVGFKPGVDRLESREALSTSTLGAFASQFVVAPMSAFTGTHVKLIPGSHLPEFNLNPNNPILKSLFTFPAGTHVKLIPGSRLPDFNLNPNNPILK